MAEKSANNPSASAHHDTPGVAMRLLRICGRGEGRAIAVGLALLLLGAAAALLQPWPMKLVIDSVIGNGQAPAFLSSTAEAISPNHPRIALLVVLCAAGAAGAQAGSADERIVDEGARAREPDHRARAGSDQRDSRRAGVRTGKTRR